MARPESWLKNYEDVEFDLSFTNNMGERVPMLPPKTHLKGESSPPSPVQWTPAPTPTPTTTATATAVPMSRETSSKGEAGVRGPGSSSTAGPGSSSAVVTTKRSSDPFSSTPASPSDSPSPPPTLAPPGTTGPIARIPRSFSSPKNFPSSPLNPLHAAPPNTPNLMPFPSPFARPGSRGSAYFSRIASEEARVLGSSTQPSPAVSSGPMILYRVADPFATVSAKDRASTPSPPQEDGLLPPPPNFSHRHRDSVYSTSGDSFVSLSSDSKYPLPASASQGSAFIAYAFDPEDDDSIDDDEIDWLHDPEPAIAAKLAASGKLKRTTQGAGGKYLKPPSESFLSSRGLLNVTMLILLIVACLSLFIAYPTVATIRDDGVNRLIAFNTRINSTGQAVDADFDPIQGTNTTTTTPVDSSTTTTSTTTTTTPSIRTATTSDVTSTSTTTTSTSFTDFTFTTSSDVFTPTTSTDVGTPGFPSPTVVRRRSNGLIWDPNSRLWVLEAAAAAEGKDDGDGAGWVVEKDPFARRGRRRRRRRRGDDASGGESLPKP